jgi:hypothetical protein
LSTNHYPDPPAPAGLRVGFKNEKSVDGPAHGNMTQAAKLNGIGIGTLKDFGRE